MRGYAQARGEPWYVLSAKHGLLQPDERVAPYDKKGLTRARAMNVVDKLIQDGVDSVQIIAGTDYTNELLPHLDEYDIEYDVLCNGLEIGERMARLDTLKQRAANTQLNDV